MSTWKTIRERAEVFRQELFGTTLKFNGVTKAATATGKDRQKALQRNDIMPEKPVIFTLLASDFAELRIKERDIVEGVPEFGEYKFQVNTITMDDADATVDLKCTLSVAR